MKFTSELKSEPPGYRAMVQLEQMSSIAKQAMVTLHLQAMLQKAYERKLLRKALIIAGPHTAKPVHLRTSRTLLLLSFERNFPVPLFGLRSLLLRRTTSRRTRCTRRAHNASAACGTWIAAMDSKPGDALHHLANGRCFGDNFNILRGSNVGNEQGK